MAMAIRQARRKRRCELFGLVGLPAKADFRRRYPHQLSGGQQQRVCIAMALACDPAFVVLDEPTTGLDVTTQEQIVALLIDLRARLGMSMLYVTHDLGLLAQIADRVGVMYAGRMVEIAPTAELFSDPKHPYTRGLIGSIPRIEDRSACRRGRCAACCSGTSCRPAALRAALRLGAAALLRGTAGAGAGRSEPRGRLLALAGDLGAGRCARRRRSARDSRHAEQLLAVDNVSVVYGAGRMRFTAHCATSASTSARARPSRWSANPAAESRPWPARSPA